MEFGKTLREAREAKGFTVGQLAEITHIYAKVIEGLESEDFQDIPAPIYGRGFVKLLCQQLDLDPKAMVEEFMAIFTGEKPAAKPAIPVDATSDRVLEKVAPPADCSPVGAIPDRVHETDATAASTESPVAAPEPPPAAPFGDLFNQPPAEEKPAMRNAGVHDERLSPEPPRSTPSRFAPPTPMDDRRGMSFSNPLGGLNIPWRFVGLVVAAIAILWIAVSGIGALYRKLSEPTAPATVKSAAVATPPGSAAKLPRAPKPVKPLYID